MAGIPIHSDNEWRGVLEALSQYCENERCNDFYDDPEKESPYLTAAEAVLERMNLALIRAVEAADGR